MNEADIHLISDENVVMFKSDKDVRYRKFLASSHDERTFRAYPVGDLLTRHVNLLCEKADVICIDEGQFIDGLVEFCDAKANQGKRVIVSGLSGTFERKPFPTMPELEAIAEHVIRLNAICVLCHKKAHFARRLVDSTDVEVIGGADKYVPCCRACWDEPIKKDILKRWERNTDRVKDMRNSTDSE